MNVFRNEAEARPKRSIFLCADIDSLYTQSAEDGHISLQDTLHDSFVRIFFVFLRAKTGWKQSAYIHYNIGCHRSDSEN